MAYNKMAVAKAAFSASLLRPDPTSVPSPEINALHSAIDRALSRGSPAYIQACKELLFQHVTSSANRIGGLAKYLVILAGPLDEPPAAARSNPSPKRRKLHILYLLNDLLHHSKYHLAGTTTFSTVSGSLQPYMVDLLGYAAAYDRQKYPRHHRRLDDLLEIWSEHGYFSPDLIHQLREVAKDAALTGAAPPSSTDILAVELDATKNQSKEEAYIIPKTHGDRNGPWYDLPAGNFLHHFDIPLDKTMPVRPENIRAMGMYEGPAPPETVEVLKKLLREADEIYDTEVTTKDDEVLDINELGQRVVRDATTGDILNGRTYYGWCRPFCQEMIRNRHPDDTRGSQSWSTAGRHKRSRHESRFPPPHQPSHSPPPHPAHPYPAQPRTYHNAPPPEHYSGASGAWPPAPPPHMPTIQFPPPGMGSNPTAFPPQFTGHPAPGPVPPGQPLHPWGPLPPGQNRFPPHSGGQHGGS
ncbi:hypothetical protein N7532_006652 [Penicillium argentinense]|uniref:CID domain-containing protein n=1 Tax=Penicillium argentinense TaxID=1131581 RepID=A0A9W9FGC7_9EURO|nr:uncharacterized protein N7532_006652 [Penicillium argentinense]KAJ5099651.1 hypothetical protein N7532_006652 [Penicillium argentinense]